VVFAHGWKQLQEMILAKQKTSISLVPWLCFNPHQGKQLTFEISQSKQSQSFEGPKSLMISVTS